MFLTSARFRRALAASLRRILAASVSPDVRPRPSAAPVLARTSLMSSSAGTGSPVRLPSWPGWPASSRSKVRFPAQGVAMVSQLLADGGGPLYRSGSRDDLNAIIERASQALTR